MAGATLRTQIWGDPKAEELLAAIINAGIPRVELGQRVAAQGKRVSSLEFAQRINRAMVGDIWRQDAVKFIQALYPDPVSRKTFLEEVLFVTEPVHVVLPRTGAQLSVDPTEFSQTLVAGQSRIFEMPHVLDIPMEWASVSGGKVNLTTGVAETVKPFDIAVTPLTNGQVMGLIQEIYEFSADHYFSREGLDLTRKGGVTSPLWWFTGEFNNGPHYADHPLVGISFYEADALLRALGMRLPTEYEWQRAGEGSTHSAFPWGNDFDPNRLNHSVGRVGRGSSPVNAYISGTQDGRSEFGIADMVGNVWEWTSSMWEPGSPYHVLRGGCWYYGRSDAFTVVTRGYDHPGFRDENVGVRGVLDLPALK
jgi:formylglycine-generating enzyme required for sulfatase activity